VPKGKLEKAQAAVRPLEGADGEGIVTSSGPGNDVHEPPFLPPPLVTVIAFRERKETHSIAGIVKE
jgi:hypothetical protein